MGTFHDDKGENHGITLVVNTHGSRVYVGRCDTEGDEGVVLLDGDVHDAEESGKPKDEYLRNASMYGVWKRYERVLVPRADIAWVRRLNELEAE